jgi:hypothetical protein
MMSDSHCFRQEKRLLVAEPNTENPTSSFPKIDQECINSMLAIDSRSKQTMRAFGRKITSFDNIVQNHCGLLSLAFTKLQSTIETDYFVPVRLKRKLCQAKTETQYRMIRHTRTITTTEKQIPSANCCRVVN